MSNVNAKNKCKQWRCESSVAMNKLKVSKYQFEFCKISCPPSFAFFDDE